MRVWGKAAGGLFAALTLSGCGFFGGKTTSSNLAFPLPQQPVAFDPWATGMVPSREAEGNSSALSINPFDPVALNNLAVVEASRGRYQQALSLLQRAVKLAPARADMAANLASLQKWMAQAQGQAALGLTPQPLQLPYQEPVVAPLPPLWSPSGGSPSATNPAASGSLPTSPQR